MTEGMIKEYLEHHFNPSPNVCFTVKSDQDTSFSTTRTRTFSPLFKPPVFACGCLVTPGK